MRSSATLIVTAVVSMLFSPAAAASSQSAGTAAVAPDATMQAAVRLIDTMDLAETSRAAMDTMVDVLLEGMDARFEHEHGETFPKELSSEVRTIVSGYLNRELSEQLPLIKQRTAAIYARHFSISELDRLTFLMSDPAMRKLTRLMPVIMPELAQTSTFTPEMGQELEALVREAVMNWASKQPRPAAES